MTETVVNTEQRQTGDTMQCSLHLDHSASNLTQPLTHPGQVKRPETNKKHGGLGQWDHQGIYCKIKIPGTRSPLPGHQLTVWEGRQGTGQGNNTDRQARHWLSEEEAHLESPTNSVITHFTIITFLTVTTVERSNGVQVRRCLSLDNKGNLWADVSTCS